MIRLLTIAATLLLLLGCKLVPDSWLEEAYDGDDDGFTSWEVGGPDCDDAQPTINPLAEERCGDGRDNDCDGTVDEADEGHGYFIYDDLDGDGWGEVATKRESCDVPPRAVRLSGDCDDTQASVHYGAPELCNERDDDCDGLIDDGAPPQRWLPDDDGDGWGDEARGVEQCLPPGDGWILAGGDCDDARSQAWPGADDPPYDGLDDDCAGDDDFDVDGDGWLHPSAGSSPSDCDDLDPTISPGAPEQPYDAVDDDCDPANDWDADLDGHTLPGAPTGSADDCDDRDPSRGPPPAWWLDADGDGHAGPEVSQASCLDPGPGWFPLATDCDDTTPAVHPGATELCDDVDGNCDGVLDELMKVPAWVDADGDGWGAGSPSPQCPLPSGQAPTGLAWREGDCDDTTPAVHPDAVDRCVTPVDEDCDPTAPADDAPLLYRDADGDGWGVDTDTVLACAAEGYVSRPGDCDDGSSTVYPGAEEVCDGVDNNCVAGFTDEDRIPGWVDADHDGWGQDGTQGLLCRLDRPAGQGGDCDDADPRVNPGEVDRCATALDEDCDLASPPDDLQLLYTDADADSWGDPATAALTCPAPGLVTAAGDCDDADRDVHPGATELCDGLDQDCDGETLTDEGREPAYLDRDGDGYGAGDLLLLCPTTPRSAVATDCDDRDRQVYPGAPDTCAAPAADCAPADLPDDATWRYVDADGDGHGSAPTGERRCPATGWVSSDDDCDDADPAIPTPEELTCDGLDEDCDGSPDDGLLQAFYRDDDGDDDGDASVAVVWACTEPPGYAASRLDCDDDDPERRSGGVEVCDGKDNDCNPVSVDDAVVCEAEAVSCVDGSFYVLLEDRKSHEQAEVECAARHGHVMWPSFRYQTAANELSDALDAMGRDVADTYLFGIRGGCPYPFLGGYLDVFAWYDDRDGECVLDSDIPYIASWPGMTQFLGDRDEGIQVAYSPATRGGPLLRPPSFVAVPFPLDFSPALVICEVEVPCLVR